MTVLCNAITCQHNSEKGDRTAYGKCLLKLIILMNVEKEDYKKDIMDCQLYQQKKSADVFGINNGLK